MTLSKDLDYAFDLGEEHARKGLPSHSVSVLDRGSEEQIRRWRDGKHLKASYEAGYDKGRVEFIRLAKEYQKAARLKT